MKLWDNVMKSLLGDSMMLSTIIDPVITGLFALIGLWLVFVLNRQIKLGVAKHRLDKYASLWSKLAMTSPMEDELGRAVPLCRGRREELYEELTSWYFNEGGGMVLSASTRDVYLRVKKNLICQPNDFVPACLQEKIKDDKERSAVLRRQFSLLRTRMKADLAVYGSLFYKTLKRHDKAFLKECGQNVHLPPWKPPPWRLRQWFQARPED
jgi:hypothetical protein